MALKAAVLAAVLASGCAWNGAPTAIKVANVAGWAAMPAGVAVAYIAPENCSTSPEFPGAMQCGRSQGIALGLGIVVIGLFTVIFTHTGFR